MNIKNIAGHFLDSGAYNQGQKAKAYYKEHGKDRWAYFHTDEFWQYMKDYVAFVKKNKIALDLYANVDAIGNAELTWRNQQWLEKRGLTPVPVIHAGTDPDLKWLKHYLSLKYTLIGFGGMAVTGIRKEETKRWLNNCFEYLCNNKEHLPIVKIHGFGLTDFKLWVRYPFYSVDSTTWVKRGAFGEILVPRFKHGKFQLLNPPYILGTSTRHKARTHLRGMHLDVLRGKEKENVYQWLEELDVNPAELSTSHFARTQANVRYFCRVQNAMPKWPWPFHRKIQKGLLP